ncbi:MAG: DUF2256 domain-containing protein [Chromatocurvus sp.]
MDVSWRSGTETDRTSPHTSLTPRTGRSEHTMPDRQKTTRGRGRPPRPEKICPVCHRPFTWRARWRLNWDDIVYCSRRCASQRRSLQKTN